MLSETGLIFPKYRDQMLRCSEQEPKTLCVSIVMAERQFRVAVEVPTVKTFCFKGNRGRSALADVALFESGYDPIALVEFKEGNRAEGIEKDLEKLIREEKTGA